MPEKGMLTDALRDRAREAGLRLATWVVDDPEELRELARFDLYGVASNRPGVMLDAIREEE
jgi:glycerophosphoryl diester phosphodiesterase